MFTKIIVLLIIYFLTGALALVFITRSGKNKKEQWTKFLVYLFIVSCMVITARFYPVIYMTLVSVIVLGGLSELLKNRLNSSSIFIGSLVIYLLLSALTIYFVLNTDKLLQLWIYMIVLTFDGFSQITGQLFGRKKITRRISPSKTLEGFLGGTFMCLFTAWLLMPDMLSPFITAGSYFILLFIVIFCAFSGDLLASAYKRKAGIKDFGTTLPGHGGILDRFDSFIGAEAGFALVVLLLLR